MDGNALPGLGAATGPDVVTLRSASAQVTSILRREIQRGDHPPHTRLRQREVATRLGVSTTPVREAFHVLHAEGFLRVESHRGAVVAQPSVDDVREGYAIRKSLEALAAREATARCDTAEAASLRTLLARMRSERSQDKWAALDLEFHHRLNTMAGMPRLLGLINNLRGGILFYIEAAFEDSARRQEADRDHVALLDTCESGDADAAERVIREHLEKTARVVVASLPDSRRGHT